MVYLMVLPVAQVMYGVFNYVASLRLCMVYLMVLPVAQVMNGVFNGTASNSDYVWCI